ncbi:MAG: AAA family ATPase, partial [Demequina sp.]
MKVLNLEIEGFGPYLRPQRIDFREFDDDIFVITGKTGAGKSTILDAIVFALYDKVPRYEGAEKSVRSDYCTAADPTVVTLEFESGVDADGQPVRYKVRRSPEFQRPKQRGEGLTTQKAEATLWVERDGEWETLAVRPVEAGHLVKDILGLTAEQFLQVILLAQGRFQEFLDAKPDKRREVLRSLFGTGRFGELERQVREVAKARSHEVEAADASLGVLVARAASEAGLDAPSLAERDQWLAATAGTLAEQAVAASDARVAAGEAADAAATVLAEARAVADKHARLAQARDTVTALESRAEEHEADRVRLDAATRARPVAAPMRAVDRADAELERAQVARDAAVEGAQAPAVAGVAWPESLGDLSEATEDELAARVSELAGEIGALSTALETELALPRLREEAESAGLEVEAAAGARDAVQAGLDALPEVARELRTARDQAATTAARAEDLEQALARAEASAQAHAQAAALATTLVEASHERDEALAGHAAATQAYNDLVQRRLRSQAAHL